MSIRTKIELIAVALLAAAILVCVLQAGRIDKLSGERDRYRNNTEALMADVETYKVRDSLNAARAQSLELTAKEYERYRAEDAALIRELTSRNRDLASVNAAQSETIIRLRAVPRDTVVIVRDSIVVPAHSVHCGDDWFDFYGIITEDAFEGSLRNRDSLVIAETVRYKRCLFWKTRKVKDRRVDVVSRNPHTSILGIEHIVIEK